jgi:hypothetical protein
LDIPDHSVRAIRLATDIPKAAVGALRARLAPTAGNAKQKHGQRNGMFGSNDIPLIPFPPNCAVSKRIKRDVRLPRDSINDDKMLPCCQFMLIYNE